MRPMQFNVDEYRMHSSPSLYSLPILRQFHRNTNAALGILKLQHRFRFRFCCCSSCFRLGWRWRCGFLRRYCRRFAVVIDIVGVPFVIDTNQFAMPTLAKKNAMRSIA